MKKVLTITALFIMSVVVLNSCSKYEDGPGFSLRSKKARIANTWKIDKITDLNTGEVVNTDEFFGFADSSSGMEYTVEIKFKMEKDGSMQMIASVMGFEFPVDGSWEFVGDTGLKITIADPNGGPSQSMEFTILRLANNELWLKDKDNYQMNLASDK